MRISKVFTIAITVLLTGCELGGDVHGTAKPSRDGKTYLVVMDDNGGGCGPILVDGKKWKYRINEAGPIAPGVHTIKCGGDIQFEVTAGTTYHFDYWGP